MNRRRFLASAAAVVAGLRYGRSAEAARDDRASQIDALIRSLHASRQFTGEILVAERGTIVYEAGFGPIAASSARQYTTETRNCLASLSKPITAVAICLLVEQGRLHYDDSLSKYLPGFTAAVGAATLRQLLAHTSGIPDYPELKVDRPGVANAEILAALRALRTPAFPPGERYAYSNSGYVLLGQIVETVTAAALPRFLDEHIFTPAGMTRTFVLTDARQKTEDVARGYDELGRTDDFDGMVTGSSGVYSTVHDLLRFDQALYGDTFVSQRTLAEAFAPASVREGSTTYGLGWNVVNDADGPRVWHQGNTAGFRAFIERRLRPRRTVIMLTNGGDTDRMGINDRIQRLLAAA